MMQPPETSDEIATPRRPSTSWTNLAGGRDLAVGPDRPGAIVEVELGDDVGQVDVGLPIGVDRPDVAPIDLRLFGVDDAGVREVMRDRFAVGDEIGDDVLAEVVRRIRIGGVAAQLIDQELGLEHVDAHAAQRGVRIAGHRRRVLRLLEERRGCGRSRRRAMTPKPLRLVQRRLEAADRHVGVRLDVLLQHLLVVHLVDVVAGQHDHVVRRVALDDVDVLIDRVGGAEIPQRLGDALRRRQDVEALVALGPEEVPAALQVADQAVRLVLRRHGDAADAGIERVRQREVDDARLAAEIDGGLGAAVGQLQQAAAAAAGEHVGHRVTRVGRAD